MKKVETCRLLRISDLHPLGFNNLATIFLKIGENDFSSNERVEPLKDKKLFYGRQGWTGDDRQKSRLQWSQTFYEVILQAALNLRCQCGDSSKKPPIAP